MTLSKLRWLNGALILATLAVAASGALTISTLRREISRSAERSADLESRIQEQRRENENRAAQIARVSSPEFLQAYLPPGLRPAREDQIIYLPLEAPERPPETPAVITVAQQTPRSITFELPILSTTANASAGDNHP